MKIFCNYCKLQATIRNNKIYMKCHCDDDLRIISMEDKIKHTDYLYILDSNILSSKDENNLTGRL